MPAKAQRKSTKQKPIAADKVRRQTEGWDLRLRQFGDARFVDVEWSGRDHPVWPLPINTKEDP